MELMVVMTIIAILSGIMWPAFRAGFAASRQYVAGHSLMQLQAANQAYTADFDDTYPLGMQRTSEGGLLCWFGYQAPGGAIDTGRGFLSSYTKKTEARDSLAASYKDYLGNHSGFGYDWEALGSDFSVTKDYSHFPNCVNAATGSSIAKPSGLIAFGTSVFYNASWLDKGDGGNYDFGFISPPRDWQGNPNLDFRHFGARTVDTSARTVTYTGNALIVHADSSLKVLKQGQIEDKMFERDPQQGS
jgi:type II secretory pathway pseudopilin PulG